MSEGVLCSPEEASCLIPSIIAELKAPCPCKGRRGLYLCGTSYDGRAITISIRPGVLEFEGITAEEVEAIRGRRCLICSTDKETLPSSAKPETS